MKRLDLCVLVAALMSFSGALGAQQPVNDRSPTVVRAQCPNAGGDDYFFPPNKFDDSNAERDAFWREWYSKHLRVMKEPSLSCAAQDDGAEVYRFVWLRTFQHPVVVRITRQAGVVSLDATELDGAGGYDPGSILRREKRGLSLKDWSRLEAAVAYAKIWEEPTSAPWEMGLDGAQWIVEARRGTTYHVVDRWSPKAGPHRELGLLFLEFSGLKFQREQTY